MKPVFGQDRRVIEWVAARIRRFPPAIRATTIGFERPGGELGCGIVYTDFCNDLDGKPNDIGLTIAFDKEGLTGPGLLRAAFAYPFGQLGVRRITTYIASDNAPSLALAERLGFVLEGRMREQIGPGIDQIVYGMKRDECRFWREHGTEIQQPR